MCKKYESCEQLGHILVAARRINWGHSLQEVQSIIDGFANSHSHCVMKSPYGGWYPEVFFCTWKPFCMCQVGNCSNAGGLPFPWQPTNPLKTGSRKQGTLQDSIDWLGCNKLNHPNQTSTLLQAWKHFPAHKRNSGCYPMSQAVLTQYIAYSGNSSYTKVLFAPTI